MIIKSNTTGKIKKMINGTVFSSETVFVKEFLQNAQRAKATVVDIFVDNSTIVFKDNGKGCKKPHTLFTLDLSDWSSTKEGFGIGFWSCLAIKGLTSIKVRSYNWEAQVFTEDLLNDNLNVQLEKDLDIIEGFEIKLYIEELSYSKRVDIEEEVANVAKYLDFSTFYNYIEVEKVDIFSSVKKGDYFKEIENKFFKALLCIESSQYSRQGFTTLFYDKREVCNIYDIGYIYGAIEVKKNMIDLKEPDRTSYIWNHKYDKFIKVLEKEVKLMYIDFLKTNPDKNMIDKYSEALNEHLNVNEYEKYLIFNDLFELIKENERCNKNKEITVDNSYSAYTIDLDTHADTVKRSDNDATELHNEEANTDVTTEYEQDTTNKTYLSDTKPDNTNRDDENCRATSNEDDYSKEYYDTLEDRAQEECTIDVSIEDIKDEFHIDDYVVQNNIHKKPTNKNLTSNTDKDIFSAFKKELKKTRKIAWALKSEAESYKEEISKAQYVGLKVVLLDNVLYANIFNKYNKMHISEFTNCFKEIYSFKNVLLKNAKEVRAIETLTPICKKFNLPLNTFVICDIEADKSIEYKGKVIYKNKVKNKKNKIEIYAVENNGVIMLDRTALNLSKFKLPKSGPIGINDLKFILHTLNTVAHELAHLLCKTKDNTIEQYNTEVRIQEEITKLYI